MEQNLTQPHPLHHPLQPPPTLLPQLTKLPLGPLLRIERAQHLQIQEVREGLPAGGEEGVGRLVAGRGSERVDDVFQHEEGGVGTSGGGEVLEDVEGARGGPVVAKEARQTSAARSQCSSAWIEDVHDGAQEVHIGSREFLRLRREEVVRDEFDPPRLDRRRVLLCPDL